MYSRRQFLSSGTTTIGASLILPYAAHAQTGGSDMFETSTGTITVHPVAHASFVMETPGMVIYNDPVGDPANYAGKPDADLILLTHEHGDHYAPDTLAVLAKDNTKLLTNPAVYDMLPDPLKSKAQKIGNGEDTTIGDIAIEAIPAYNLTEDRLKYHPKGRDNGYVLTIGGSRIYIAGDTEDIPEMRALTDIDLAFVPMNLPYTMDVNQAASAIAAFKPKHVYPYHYGESNVDSFGAMVAEGDSGTIVHSGKWYS
ncbi:MBL fold metallo-hydrolase [Amylibacter kogurei]|uniref:MBL fold metallo-hydrolase n=1 Tax=Paramylibacter kogurei TaxID=1889778 RepID=A0A2G5K8J4_9RHOB|nr:MBL fold metallo-hydrolase [Amylibacter kogurei]PIB25858.1 MBL fold metallo-hydrolase [Amylibacter kogurei]